jgi:phage FluMu protein Com
MDDIKDYMVCDNCKNKNFMRIYNFALQFRKVNFSDDVIYDEVSEELYQCTHCQKIFTKQQIDAHLKDMAKERLGSFSDGEG